LSGFSRLSIEHLERDHVVIKCNLKIKNKTIETFALVDCGATTICVIDKQFAGQHALPLFPLNEDRILEVIDRPLVSSGNINHLASAELDINSHGEDISIFVAKLGHDPLFWEFHGSATMTFLSLLGKTC
jgi:hypothetical protein